MSDYPGPDGGGASCLPALGTIALMAGSVVASVIIVQIGRGGALGEVDTAGLIAATVAVFLLVFGTGFCLLMGITEGRGWRAAGLVLLLIGIIACSGIMSPP